MDLRKLQRTVIDALEDVKAQDIKVFDTSGLTSLFDRVVIASGSSNRQTRALAASVHEKVKQAGWEQVRTEGEDTGEWVLVDLGDVVVHIMQPAIRAYYLLEDIWGGKPVRVKLGQVSTGLVKASEGDDEDEDAPAASVRPRAARKPPAGAARAGTRAPAAGASASGAAPTGRRKIDARLIEDEEVVKPRRSRSAEGVASSTRAPRPSTRTASGEKKPAARTSTRTAAPTGKSASPRTASKATSARAGAGAEPGTKRPAARKAAAPGAAPVRSTTRTGGGVSARQSTGSASSSARPARSSTASTSTARSSTARKSPASAPAKAPARKRSAG